MAKMLCEAAKGPEGKLPWTEVEAKAFIDIKQALILVQVLALPDITKPFCLFVDKKSGGAHSKTWVMALPDSMFIYKTGSCKGWMASLLENYGSSGPAC